MIQFTLLAWLLLLILLLFDTRLIDFAGHSESAETAETEPGTQKLFFFLMKTETKQQMYERKIYLNW
jgi:hypothetical protein